MTDTTEGWIVRETSQYWSCDKLDGKELVEGEYLLVMWPEGFGLARVSISGGADWRKAKVNIPYLGWQAEAWLVGLRARRPTEEPCRIHGLHPTTMCKHCLARFGVE